MILEKVYTNLGRKQKVTIAGNKISFLDYVSEKLYFFELSYEEIKDYFTVGYELKSTNRLNVGQPNSEFYPALMQTEKKVYIKIYSSYSHKELYEISLDKV